MPKLRESILADIHHKNIRPRARWQYVMLHIGLWCSGIITLILGSFACAFTILELSLPERAYIRWMEMHENTGWLLALPYLWGIGMIFALTIGYFVFSKTGRSYRLHAGMIAGVLVAGSLLWGEILYITRMAHWSDRQIQRFEPRYRDMRQNFARMLPRPEEGMLPLRVMSIEWDTIQGTTPDGYTWDVKLKCSDYTCREKKKKISTGRPVIFEWEISGDGQFEAREIEFPPRLWPRNMHQKESPFKKDTSLGNETDEKKR